MFGHIFITISAFLSLFQITDQINSQGKSQFLNRTYRASHHLAPACLECSPPSFHPFILDFQSQLKCHLLGKAFWDFFLTLSNLRPIFFFFLLVCVYIFLYDCLTHVCLPNQPKNSMQVKILLFALQYPWCLAQCLTPRNHSVNIYRVNESLLNLYTNPRLITALCKQEYRRGK